LKTWSILCFDVVFVDGDTHIKPGIPHSIYWLITVKIHGYSPLTVPVMHLKWAAIDFHPPWNISRFLLHTPPVNDHGKKGTYLLAFSAGCFLHIFL
jgi:hypothetical protein